MGGWWRVDETYLKIGGRQRYLFRAIDEHGQIVDVYLSDRRDAAAARAFFEGAIYLSSVMPTRVMPDKAKCYPPMLRIVLPLAEHRSSRYLNNGLERDHQHGHPPSEGRGLPMRRFKTAESTSTFCRGHALIQNFGRGFSSLSEEVSPRLWLATAWSVLLATSKPADDSPCLVSLRGTNGDYLSTTQ